MSDTTVEELRKILREQNYILMSAVPSGDAPNTYLIKIAKDAPPPLGVHVTDGLASKDKPGGA